jgi:hypothetical protein
MFKGRILGLVIGPALARAAIRDLSQKSTIS